MMARTSHLSFDILGYPLSWSPARIGSADHMDKGGTAYLERDSCKAQIRVILARLPAL